MPQLAKSFPKLTFQPSEYETRVFTSIREYSKNCDNVLEPVRIDIAEKLEDWKSETNGKPLNTCHGYFDYILNVNMIHITPFVCTEMLFINSSKLLKPNGLLFTYGPYSINHVLTPESNVRFNESLKSQNSSWGVRDISDLEKVANMSLITLEKIHDLPSNNKLLVWKKSEN
jgi:hypothetical protein